VTGLLASEPKTSADLWKIVKPLGRVVESPEATISLDDSISEKPYTDENDLIAWHWSHHFERHGKGLEFLTAYYQVAGVSLPIAFDIVEKNAPYVAAKTGKAKRRSPITKTQRYLLLLRVAVHHQVQFRYVLNDVWFASADNLKDVKTTLKKDFIMPLKSNRQVALREQGKRSGRYVAVSTLDLPANTTCEVWLESGPFPVLLSRQVFTNDDGSTGIRYLVTSDLALAHDQITKLFQKRWGIEV
jgi:hypothetical protein